MGRIPPHPPCSCKSGKQRSYVGSIYLYRGMTIWVDEGLRKNLTRERGEEA
jgi:hypothetical protein